ncbi:hypothetical protein D6C00_13845 [Thiohalobacter thiocyanaticus]|uniref:Uncharacterized protein n=1 Tax=Thiohalobacter thiocyanaticus TaxID=585455 RepID=A0A426QMB7_9GAMM|nr:hypothetical protein D6C00_13845 [Thiohalobacter thiocyanaticus]
MTEQNKKRVVGTLGGGVAGAVLLGPVGAIGGLLIGGNGKQVTVSCSLKDGRRFLATTDSKTYQKLLSMTY